MCVFSYKGEGKEEGVWKNKRIKSLGKRRDNEKKKNERRKRKGGRKKEERKRG